mmetsp:Transcript_73258/g.207655  ORF Transcript_73258/g.207655 Transcript_73258/m.207655 type:complete len:179 (-) Transcript_73258:66-602(-)
MLRWMVDQGVSFPEALLMMGQFVTSVGYGSHTPSTDGMKIFHAMHALLGSAFVTSQMDNMVDKLTEMWKSTLPAFMWQLPCLTAALLAGTFGYAEDFHEGSPGDYPTYESALLDAFYMTIFTLTTVGYGDVSPTTPWGMGLSAAWMITGTRAFARFVGTINGDSPEPAGPLMDWGSCS